MNDNTHFPKLFLQGQGAVALLMRQAANALYGGRSFTERGQGHQRGEEVGAVGSVEPKSRQPFFSRSDFDVLPLLEGQGSTAIHQGLQDRFIRLGRVGIKSLHLYLSRDRSRRQQEGRSAPVPFDSVRTWSNIGSPGTTSEIKFFVAMIFVLYSPSEMAHDLQRQIDIGPALQVLH